MRNWKFLGVLGVMALAAACADLDVVNPNDADRDRALTSPGDIEALISGSFRTYWLSTHHSSSSAMPLSVSADEHTSSAANFAMLDFYTEPRLPINNSPTYSNATNISFTWTYSYRAVSSVNEGLRAIKGGVNLGNNGSDNIRAQAFGRFVQGLAHGTVARLYDRGVVVDETTDLKAGNLPLVPYTEVRDAALKFLDEAISLSEKNTFTLPGTWINGNPLTSKQLAQLAHSYKARIRAQTARTAAERQAVNWDAVIADVDAGLQADFNVLMDDVLWWDDLKTYTNYPGWGWWDLRFAGMADTTGAYQKWMATPVASRQPFLLASPDKRFPKAAATSGADSKGTMVQYTSSIGGNPTRGTYNWSNYRDFRYLDYISEWDIPVPELTATEMRMLKAEGLYRKGDRAGAANLINVTRVAKGGLPPATATGIPNTAGCVPKLADGTCGDLLEALKWEKRVEVWSVTLGDWHFDSRGWGDLVAGSPLHFPVPGAELEIFGEVPYTFGGVGGNCAAGSACTPAGGPGTAAKLAGSRFGEVVPPSAMPSMRSGLARTR